MKDIEDLLEGLRRTPRVLAEFVSGMPEGKLDLRRGESFWTVAEHVSHLAQVQPMLLERMKRFINEDRPEFIPYIPGDEEEAETPLRISMADAVDQFAQFRKRQLGFLKDATEPDWKKGAAHPEYETYTLYILTRHALMHDYWHMYRMEELWLTRDEYLTEWK